MPFSAKDPQGELFASFQELGVSVVVLLVSKDECLARSGRDLAGFYAEQGLEIIHLPIVDFSVPDQKALENAVVAVLDRAWAGKNIVVHCFAGYGRTGMFLACIARCVFNMTAQAAVLWVREYVPGAIEVSDQIQVVEEFSACLS